MTSCGDDVQSSSLWFYPFKLFSLCLFLIISKKVAKYYIVFHLKILQNKKNKFINYKKFNPAKKSCKTCAWTWEIKTKILLF